MGPVSNEQRQSTLARARHLAAGLQTFHPRQDLPASLWETAYLLEECQNVERSLLERLRILGLMATSLDQFFINELPRWQEQAGHGSSVPRWLAELPYLVEPMLRQASNHLNNTLLPALAQSHQLQICLPSQLVPEETQWLRRFFQERVYPLLTPLAIDPGHPFPFISTFSLNFLVLLRSQQPGQLWGRHNYARIKVPRLLPSFLELPRDGWQSAIENNKSARRYLPSEEVVRYFLPELFPGLPVEGAYLFRVVRAVDALHARDLPLVFGTRQHELGLPVVRLDVEQTIPEPLLAWLTEHLEAPSCACFRLPQQYGELHLVDLANLLEDTPGTDPFYGQHTRRP